MPEPPPPPKRPPPPGATIECVIPFARATGMCSLAGWMAVCALRCGFQRPSSLASFVTATAPTSVSPSELNESIMPGKTCFPSPSMISASAGMSTSAPTAMMRPSRITIVPPSITPSATV